MADSTHVVLTDSDNAKTSSLAVLRGSVGTPALDIGKLNKETGYFTYDPGFVSTASCRSAITYIDGDEGILMYRGYPIEQLAEKSSFVEVTYALMYGDLPTAAQLKDFEAALAAEADVDASIHTLIGSFAQNAHPMAILASAIAQLSAKYHDDLDLSDEAQRQLAAIRLTAKVPTLSALIYRHGKGLPLNRPDASLDYVSRFLKQTFESADGQYELNPSVVKAMDLLFILHADHEQNASTSTVRLVGSTGANPYASVAAGVTALWGPAHGGANEAVLKMLEEIGSADNVESAVVKAKDKTSGFRLMGFGHRVYKNFDPRAKIIGEMTKKVLGELGVTDPLLDVAVKLEKAALEDEYFVARKLYPNVDFYSGIIYKALNIPTELFTVMFALGRTPGWVSHWLEQQNDPENKIGRPRQIYTGSVARDYVDIDARG